MNILVTGGAGFIGTNLIKRLVKEGHTVTSLDDYSTGSELNHIKGCTYISGECTMLEYLITSKFDLVYHLAGLSRIQPSFIDPMETFHANVIGTQAVCDWARKNSVNVVYAGSSSKHHDPYQSPYAAYKYIGEEICKMYKKTYGMSIEICRFYNVYGPHEVVEGDWAAVIGIWRRQVEARHNITIVGDGEQRRDFTHVDDIVDGLIRVANTTICHEDAWELGCGKNHSINEVASWFCEYNPTIEIEHIPDQKGNYRETLRETNDAVEKLGWRPTDKLRSYIQSLYQTQLKFDF